jgi:hypothetical protein
MPELDLEPAAREVAGLLDGVTDDRLSAPTPCGDMPVAALLDHLIGLSVAFTEAARKTASGSSAPQSIAEHLDPGWRTVCRNVCRSSWSPGVTRRPGRG